MATIDTSIYGRVGKGADLGNLASGFSAGQQIRGQRNKNRLQEMAMAERETINEEYKNAYDQQSGRFDQNKLFRGMASRGMGSAIPELQKSLADTQKAHASAQATERDANYKMIQWGRNGMATARTPQDARNYLMTGVQYGFLTPEMAQQEAASIPDDPYEFEAWRQQTSQSLLSAQQQLDNHYKQQGLELQQTRLAQGSLSAPNQSTQGFFRAGSSGVEFLTDPETGERLMPINADIQTQEDVAKGKARGKVLGEAEGKQETGEFELERLKQTAPLAEEARAALTQGESTMASVDRNIGYIDRLLANEDGLKGVIGQLGQYKPTWMMTDKELSAHNSLDEIKSKVVLNTMQEMRAASAAGATGFGNMSNQQLQIIEDSLGSLSRATTYEQITTNLKIIRDAMQGIRNSAQSQIQSTHATYGNLPGVPKERMRGQGQEMTATRPLTQSGVNSMPTISSPEEMQSLPSGTVFRAPDGSIRKVP